MSETGIVLVRQGVTGLIAYLGRHRPRVTTCATCRSVHQLRKLERYPGFCRDCLDRSHIDAGDDLGGES